MPQISAISLLAHMHCLTPDCVSDHDFLYSITHADDNFGMDFFNQHAGKLTRKTKFVANGCNW